MKFLDLFKFFTVKQKLLSNSGEWIDTDNVIEEIKELPSNYVRTYDSKGVNYIIVENTERLGICNLLGLDWFDKSYYTVFTDFVFNDEIVSFDTKTLDCIHSQIDLQILLFAIYNSTDEYVFDEYDEYEK